MKNRFAILTYHSIDDSGSVLSTDGETLDRQMAILEERGLRGITLAEAVLEARQSGAWPADAVAITFDDGYANNLTVAQPILDRHGFRATIYLITDHVGAEHDWEEPPPGLGRQDILDWSQVNDLQAAGWEIGAHTKTHPNLRELSAVAVAAEILGSKEAIEQRLGARVETFAYPGGHDSPAAHDVVAEAFGAGVTTILARSRAGDAWHVLPRVDMYYLRDPDRMRRLAEGRLDGFLAVRRAARRVRALLR